MREFNQPEWRYKRWRYMGDITYSLAKYKRPRVLDETWKPFIDCLEERLK